MNTIIEEYEEQIKELKDTASIIEEAKNIIESLDTTADFEEQKKLKTMTVDSLKVIENVFFKAANTIKSLSERLDEVYFGVLPDTFLNSLLCYGYNPEDYLDALENIEIAKKDKEYFAEHPKEADKEEMEYIDSDIEQWEETIENMLECWQKPEKVDMEKELALLKRWVEKTNNK